MCDRAWRNLLGCFHNEAKANYQESPAVFTGKRASVVEEAEEEMDEGAIRISGVCLITAWISERKKKLRNSDTGHVTVPRSILPFPPSLSPVKEKTATPHPLQ